ncbi:MAG: protease family protein, partial [Mucilaginibacter sp.]|nr:protease family protein [Mucilaginibacter sp.]
MKSPNPQSIKAIALYLLFTFSLSCIFYFLIIYTGKMGRLYAYGIMWCPAFAALITCKILKRKISSLGWAWGKSRYMLWSYLIPLLYALVAYLVIWITGWGAFYNHDFVVSTAKLLGWEHLSDGTVI